MSLKTISISVQELIGGYKRDGFISFLPIVEMHGIIFKPITICNDSCALRVLKGNHCIAIHWCGAFYFNYHFSSMTFKLSVALNIHIHGHMHTCILVDHTLYAKYLILNKNMKVCIRHVLFP